MTKTETKTETFRALLEQRQAELIAEGDLEIVPESAEDDTVRKPDDDAKPLAEMNQVIASTRNLTRNKELREIAEALVRLSRDPDEFGQCEGCDDAIPARRMELMPWVTLCIRCQARQENDRTQGRRRHLTDYD